MIISEKHMILVLLVVVAVGSIFWFIYWPEFTVTGDATSAQGNVVGATTQCEIPGYEACAGTTHDSSLKLAYSYNPSSGFCHNLETALGDGHYVMEGAGLVEYKCTGSRAYIALNTGSWSEIWNACNGYGGATECPYNQIPLQGATNLVDQQQAGTSGARMVCLSSNAKVGTSLGFSYIMNIPNQGWCCSDGSCQQNYYCDRPGNPFDWTCKEVVCNEDGDACTEDKVITVRGVYDDEHVCAHEPIPGCCNTNNDCELDEVCSFNDCIPLNCDPEVKCQSRTLTWQVDGPHRCEQRRENVDCCGAAECPTIGISGSDEVNRICMDNECVYDFTCLPDLVKNEETMTCDECAEGQTSSWTCTDESEVPHCECVDNKWECTEPECPLAISLPIIIGIAAVLLVVMFLALYQTRRKKFRFRIPGFKLEEGF